MRVDLWNHVPCAYEQLQLRLAPKRSGATNVAPELMYRYVCVRCRSMDKQEMRQRRTIKAELTSCATVILSIPIVASSASETDLCCFDYQSMYHVHVALLEHMTWAVKKINTKDLIHSLRSKISCTR
jgi:hypothetical protein